MPVSRHILTTLALVLCTLININAQQKVVYEYEIHEEIGPAMSRLTETAIAKAEAMKASYILVNLNTYGGLVEDGDKIRTALLKTKIPTVVFVQNNAASAGALIAIACDSIYMTPGSTIGAASVVNQQGELMPEKYQSYMRKKMRATAEETGRNPLIAEGMTDENLAIDSIKEKGKIVTFSTKEAIKYGYCNGEVESVQQVVSKLSGGAYTVVKHQSSVSEAIALWLINPAISGVLLLVIFGGIYFEFKAPGTFLPIGVSIVAAILYFAPLYVEGLAANWEIIVFIVGLILVFLEIFVIPGFGITGISGIVLTIGALTLALVRNINFDFTFVPSGSVAISFLMVTVAMAVPLILLVAFGQQIFSSTLFQKMSVATEMKHSDGYSVKESGLDNLVGQNGVAVTDLRPAGKVEVNGERYDVVTDSGFVAKDSSVKVIGLRSNYLVVEKI